MRAVQSAPASAPAPRAGPRRRGCAREYMHPRLTVADDFSHECVDIAVDWHLGRVRHTRARQRGRLRWLPGRGATRQRSGIHGLGASPRHSPHSDPARAPPADAIYARSVPGGTRIGSRQFLPEPLVLAEQFFVGSGHAKRPCHTPTTPITSTRHSIPRIQARSGRADLRFRCRAGRCGAAFIKDELEKSLDRPYVEMTSNTPNSLGLSSTGSDSQVKTWVCLKRGCLVRMPEIVGNTASRAAPAI